MGLPLISFEHEPTGFMGQPHLLNAHVRLPLIALVAFDLVGVLCEWPTAIIVPFVRCLAFWTWPRVSAGELSGIGFKDLVTWGSDSATKAVSHQLVDGLSQYL